MLLATKGLAAAGGPFRSQSGCVAPLQENSVSLWLLHYFAGYGRSLNLRTISGLETRLAS
jgi:hypothetical protein